MHGEQQSWHDWDPSKYETKTQPKVQTVDRLQNWSVKDKQNKKWLWFLEGEWRGRSFSILRTTKSRARKREKKSESNESFVFLAFSLVSPSGNFPWPMTEGIKQACSHPKTETSRLQLPEVQVGSGQLARQPTPRAGDVTSVSILLVGGRGQEADWDSEALPQCLTSSTNPKTWARSTILMWRCFTSNNWTAFLAKMLHSAALCSNLQEGLSTYHFLQLESVKKTTVLYHHADS